jgi:enoyl-[acyl-carrier protein] reductase II
MAGQSVGLIDQVRPLKDALADLIKEAEEELERVKEQIKHLDNKKENC